MNHFWESYIRHAKLIVAFYCSIPTIAYFGAMMFVPSFREVYMLRLSLALLLGGALEPGSMIMVFASG